MRWEAIRKSTDRDPGRIPRKVVVSKPRLWKAYFSPGATRAFPLDSSAGGKRISFTSREEVPG
jgi:hypothetical protein